MSNLILGLDEAGTPQGWLTYKTGLRHYAKGYIKWHIGNDVIYHGGVSRMTGEQTSIGIPSIIAIRNVVYHQYKQPTLSNRGLFGRDLGMCAYCGDQHDQFHTDKLTRDHILAVSRGGPNTWTNCVTACKSCNNRKGSKSLDELGWQLLYVPYVPNHFEIMLLANRKILTDQMEFLKARLPKHSRLL